MDVDGIEAGARECGGHLDLAVDALLAQDRDARARALGDVRRCDVGGGSKRSCAVRPAFAASMRVRVLFVGARGVVAAARDLVRDVRPARAELAARCVEHELRRAWVTRDALAGDCAADRVDARCRAAANASRTCVDVLARDLDDRAELLGEQRAERIGCERGDVELEAEAGRERHLERARRSRRRRSGRGRRQLAVGDERLHRREERAQPRRIVEIGRHVAELTEHLREAARAEAALPCAEIDEQQLARCRAARG